MQQSLKPATGTAGAWVVATELLEEFFRRVHDSVTALNSGFGRETFPALTYYLETNTGRGAWS
jgi:hypothetical protein